MRRALIILTVLVLALFAPPVQAGTIAQNVVDPGGGGQGTHCKWDWTLGGGFFWHDNHGTVNNPLWIIRWPYERCA